MPCEQGIFGTGNRAPMAERVISDSVVSTNDRWLVVSNSPETLNTTTFPAPHRWTLYKRSITVPASGELKLRLFLWHLNSLGEDDTIAFQLRLGIAESGKTGTVIKHKKITSNPLIGIVDNGICLAAAQRFSTLEDVTPGQTVPGGGAEWALSLGSATQTNLLGAVHELDITAEGGTTLNLRTVASVDSDFGSFTADPVNDVGHARGSWPYCNVTVASTTPFDGFAPRGGQYYDVQEFDVDGDLSEERELYYKQSGDVWATELGNKGLFGVNIDYVVHAKNDSPDQLNCMPTIRARNTATRIWAGAVAGAIEVIGHPGGRVPLLEFGNSASSIDLQGPKLPPLTPDTKITVRFAVAGGTNYEVALTYRSSNSTAGPPIPP